MREWRDLRQYYRALADVRRLRIIAELARTPEIGVKDLCLRLRASQPLVSWHLRVLRRSGLIRTHRRGRQVLCSLDRTAFAVHEARLARLIGDGVREGPLDVRDDPARRPAQQPSGA